MARKQRSGSGRCSTRRFGYNGTDDTVAVAAALSSGSAAIEIPYMSGHAWLVQPLTMPTGKTLYIQDGGILKAAATGYGAGDKNLVAANLISDFSVLGAGIAILQMSRESLSVTADGPHCLNVRGCTDFNIKHLTIENASGDGVYLGPDTTGDRTPCEDAVVYGVTTDGCRRQGCSITAGRRIAIDNCIFRHSGTTIDGVAGASPKAGLDIEPSSDSDQVVDILVQNCLAEDNDQTGFMVNVSRLTGTSEAVSILIKSCTARGGNFGIRAVSTAASSVGPLGTIEFRDCDISGTAWQGLWIDWDPGRAHSLKFTRCVFRNCAQTQPGTFPILIANTDNAVQQPTGGIEFQDCVVIDNMDRVPVALELTDTMTREDLRVTGNITVINPLIGTSGRVDCGIPGLDVQLSPEMPPWPTSDSNLRVSVNGKTTTLTGTWYETQLITDFQSLESDDPDAINAWYAGLIAIRDTDRTILNWTGRYLSGRRVEGDGVGVPHDRWPHEAVDSDEITGAYLGYAGNADWVDISVAAARTEFIDAIMEQVRLARRPILFLDNMSHPNPLGGVYPAGSAFEWADTCTFLSTLRDRLHAVNVHLLPNISGASFQWSAAEQALIIPAVDGFSSETFWHPQCFDPNVFASAATRSANTLAQIALYRAFLNQGKIVIGIPVAADGYTQAENGTFQCACAMLAWQPGLPLFVCVGQDADWELPATLGAPLGEVSIAGTNGNFLTYTREFENGTLEIDTETRTYAIT